MAHPAWGAVLAVLVLWASGAARVPPEVVVPWTAILCVLLLLAGEGLRRRLPWLARFLGCAASAGLVAGAVAAIHPAELIPWWLGAGVALLAAFLALLRLDLRSGLTGGLIGLAGALIVTGLSNPVLVVLAGLLILAYLWDGHRLARELAALIVVGALLSVLGSMLVPTLASPAPLGDRLEILAGFAVLFVLLPWLAQWGSERPQAWSGLAAVAWVGLFLVLGSLEDGLVKPWRGAAALAFAGIALLLALPGALRLRREPQSEVARGMVAPLLAAAAVLVVVALPYELERAWQGIGCALAAPVMTWLAVRLRDERLRTAAILLMIAAILWLFADRAEVARQPGSLAWAYSLGLPLLALGLAVVWHLRWLARRGPVQEAA